MGEFGDGSIMGDAQHAAVFAAGQQSLARRILDAGEEACIGLGHLLAAIQPMDGARRGSKDRDVSEKMGRDNMTFDIERGDCRHTFRLSFRQSSGVKGQLAPVRRWLRRP